ncbi:unnamed protein product [Caenorhabditis nigoni]
MVAELLITTDMITCFKSCIGQKNYKHFFDKYKLTLCKDLDNLNSVRLENETSMVIAQNMRKLVRHLENFNPQYPGNTVQGAYGAGSVREKINDDMKGAILGMNWNSFYKEYIPYIDYIINKAREQKIIFVKVEHENNWYPNFSSRERGHPFGSKNSGEALKVRPISHQAFYSYSNGSHSNDNTFGNETNNFPSGTKDIHTENNSTILPPVNMGNRGGTEIETSHLPSESSHRSPHSSDNSRDFMSSHHNGVSADPRHDSLLSVECRTLSSKPGHPLSLVTERNLNARTELGSENPHPCINENQTISKTHEGLTGPISIRNGLDTSKSGESHHETSRRGDYNTADSYNHNGTSTEKEINYGIQASEEPREPVGEVVDSSIAHESTVASEKRFSTPIEHNYELGSNWQHQTFPGTNSRMRSVSIERNDGPKGFGTVGTIPVESHHHDYSIISSNTMQDTPSQYGTLSEDAQRNQTNNYQSLSKFEIPYSPPGTLPGPKEPEAWAEQALNSLRPPTPDEPNSIQEEKYDNEFYSYSADMSCLNHQADEMVEKGKHTGEELREQKDNQFYAPLDSNISLESEEDNSSFNEHLEQLKAKQREELEEKRRERRKRQAELEEEMRKLRNESKERFRIFISCILLRIRFEEQEQHWMDWITSCRNHIVSLHRYFSIFEQEYHTVFGRKHQPDSDDLEEFQKERRRFHSFLIEVFNDLEDDFGKLNSIEGYSEVLFLRILQSCLANVATELLAIVDLVANLPTDKQSFAQLEETISKLRTDKIYSTSKLREICKTSEGSENYQNVKFPKLSSEPIIEETY